MNIDLPRGDKRELPVLLQGHKGTCLTSARDRDKHSRGRPKVSITPRLTQDKRGQLDFLNLRRQRDRRRTRPILIVGPDVSTKPLRDVSVTTKGPILARTLTTIHVLANALRLKGREGSISQLYRHRLLIRTGEDIMMTVFTTTVDFVRRGTILKSSLGSSTDSLV